MARRTDTRDKMVSTAATLFQRQGIAATGWRQIVAESGTPWGSQSHHFPGGKEELAVAALTKAGADYERLVRHAFGSQHPADAVRTWVDVAGGVLEATGWTDGCPVATVALERAHDGGPIGETCRSVLASWRDAIAVGLGEAGADTEQSARVATLVLASIEGALLLARAERDRRPLVDVGEQLATMLEATLPRKE